MQVNFLRRIVNVIILINFFLLLTLGSKHVYAERILVDANPKLVSAGEIVTIVIPNLTPVQDDWDAKLNEPGERRIQITAQTERKEDQYNKQNGAILLTSTTCNAQDFPPELVLESCAQSGTGKRWNAVLKFNTTGLAKTGTIQFYVRVLPGYNDTYGETTFTVKGNTAQTASFSIESVSPNPISPEQPLEIKLKNTIKGKYTYFFQGEGNFWSIDGSKKYEEECQEGTCTLPAIGPKYSAASDEWGTDSGIADPTNPTVVLTIIGPNGDYLDTVLNYVALEEDWKLYAKAASPPCSIAKDSKGVVRELKTGEKPTKEEICIALKTGLPGVTFGTNAQTFVESLFSLILGLSGGLALLLIILSGYKVILARGNPEKMTGAKESLTSAIVGLLFIIFSLVILEVIGVDILKLPTWDQSPIIIK